MSYTRRKASDLRLEAAHKPRYSSWPAVSVMDRKYGTPSTTRVTEYESSARFNQIARCHSEQDQQGGYTIAVSTGRSAAPALQVLRRRVAGHPACKRSVVRK
ncbi:hypothetical protein AtubIFM57143_007629 [Aspergillus tubingensis]|nr:hypothetical protein AtubIFM57143_007629 [Aspergillus tubingensis]